MKNPWVIYVLARLGLFALILAVFLLLGFEGIYSAIIAGVMALALSLLLLQKQRDALSRDIYKKFQRDDNSAIPDSDADVENAILDSKIDDK
jgi:hypothetical protein